MVCNINKYFPNSGSRNDVRMRVVNEFSKEEPGKGNGDLSTKYNYFVETLEAGNHIILTRPANLHNGFDFVVRAENINFNIGKGRYRDNPTHDDIIEDLWLKKQENPRNYIVLYNYIIKVYYCEEIQDSWFYKQGFHSGYPCDLIVKTIKWLFIEQDIRYWNYSGRNMLMSGLPS